MLMLEVCRLYGWDYYTYQAQPVWFVDLIHERMAIDGKKAEAENKKAQLRK
jgi:hypothetical protein